jgi:hypothetical protein
MRNPLRILGATRKILLLRYLKCSVRMAAWHRTECHPAIRNPLRIGLGATHEIAGPRRRQLPVKTA